MDENHGDKSHTGWKQAEARHSNRNMPNTAGYLSFGPMDQCVVHALKGLACCACVTPAGSPASHCKQCSALTSPSLHAPVLLAHANVTENMNIFQWVQNVGTLPYPYHIFFAGACTHAARSDCTHARLTRHGTPWYAIEREVQRKIERCDYAEVARGAVIPWTRHRVGGCLVVAGVVKVLVQRVMKVLSWLLC